MTDHTMNDSQIHALAIRFHHAKVGQRLLLWALLPAVLSGLGNIGQPHIIPIFWYIIGGGLILVAAGFYKINQALELHLYVLASLALVFLATSAIPFAHVLLIIISYVFILMRYKAMAIAAESRTADLAPIPAAPQPQPQSRAHTKPQTNPPAAAQTTPQPTQNQSALAAMDPEIKDARVYLRAFMPIPQWMDPNETITEVSFGDTEAQKQNDPICTLAHCGFMAFFANDHGNNLHCITKPTTARLGMRNDALYKIGINNLDHYAFHQCKPGIQIAKNTTGSHFRISLDGDFDASLMLLDKVWNHLEMHMRTPNGIVAAIPDRSTLLFCDAAQLDSILNLAQQAKEVFAAAQSRAITERLFIRRHQRWTEYTGSEPLTPTQALQQKFGAFVIPQLLRVQPVSSWSSTLHNADLSLTETDRVTQKQTTQPGKMLHGGFIVAFAAMDPTLNAMQRISEQQLTQSGLNANQLLTIALENLYDISGADRQGVNLYFKPRGAIFEVKTLDDNILESSLMLLDSVWDAQIKTLFSTPPIAAMPNQNKVAFCDSSSDKAIRELQNYANAQQTDSAQTAGFNTQLYIRENGLWTPHIPANQRATVHQATDHVH